ncbi:19876_t:CDS:2, partial [Gigaspora rosea]
KGHKTKYCITMQIKYVPSTPNMEQNKRPSITNSFNIGNSDISELVDKFLTFEDGDLEDIGHRENNEN